MERKKRKEEESASENKIRRPGLGEGERVEGENEGDMDGNDRLRQKNT